MKQFGINVGELEKITLDEAKSIVRNYTYTTQNKIIKEYLGLQNESTFISMTKGLKGKKLAEIITAIKEGQFEVKPEMLGLKKKSFLKRFFESRKNKNILDAPKPDPTEGLGLKHHETIEERNFIPPVDISPQQPLIPTSSKNSKILTPSKDSTRDDIE